MALYLTEGGDSNRLLGLLCCHVLIRAKEANIDYICHPSAPSRDILLLSRRAFTTLVNSIKVRIRRHGAMVESWRKQIEGLVEERGTNSVNSEEVKEAWVETQWLLDQAKNTMEALAALLNWINNDWKRLETCILGHVLHSPAISLGIGEHCFTEDWGIFQVDWAKLGGSFEGNKLNLGAC
jgi:hypothetical protein